LSLPNGTTEKGKIKVTEEDNAMLLLEHDKGVISHVQSGFNYFNPHGHDGKGEQRHTITIVGSGGFMGWWATTGRRSGWTSRRTSNRSSSAR